MDEALKMMTKYILEENVSQREEIRSLRDKLENLEDNYDYLMNREGKQNNDMIKLRETIKKHIDKWKDGRPSYISIYSDASIEIICDILGIYEHDKAIF